MAVLEEAGAGGHRVDDLLLREHGADRLVAAAQALRDRHEVGHDAFLLARVQRPGAAHPAHHLVQDQQDAVPVADLAHRLEIAGDGQQRARRRAADGLGDERDHAPFAARADRRVELGGEPCAVGRVALVVAPIAVRVARCDVLHVDQQRRELLPSPGVAADRERAERVAVVALPPPDEDAALGLPDLDEILARHLERRLDRLGAAAHEVRMARAGGRGTDELIGERFGGLRGEEARVRVREPVDLRVHRREHVGMAVAEARHGGAAGRVEILLAGCVDEPHAAAADGHRRRRAQLAVEDVRHRRGGAGLQKWGGRRYGTPASGAMIAAQEVR